MFDIKPMSVIVEDEHIHKAFMKAVLDSIDEHIRAMGMIKGMIARNTYAAVKAVRPGYVEHILNVISKEYVREFTPMHDNYRAEQNLPADNIMPLIKYINLHKSEAEKHFWSVADGYAAKRSNTFIGKTYKTFRPTLASHLPTVFDVIFNIIEGFTLVKI